MSERGAQGGAKSTPRISKVQRWLDLIATLLSRRTPATADEILSSVPWYARRWIDGDERERGNARRRFELDKEELRALGIPIETVEKAVRVDGESRDGYRLTNRDFYLPVLELVSATDGETDGFARELPVAVEITQAEARLAIDGLRRLTTLPGHLLEREARSALRKLTFDVDRYAFPAPPVLIAARSTAVADPETLRALLEATRARSRVRFEYRGIARNEVTSRDVAPYALLFQRGCWYLIGHDPTRGALRTFRVSRIHEVERGSGASGGEYQVPDDFDVQDHLGREAWELSGEDPPLVVRVELDVGPALQTKRRGLGKLLEERPDGSSTWEFGVNDVEAFVRWVLAFSGRASILEPDAVVESARDVARQVARLHAPARTHRDPKESGRRHRRRGQPHE